MTKRILITAAAAGIGAAIARRAKADGYDVIISDVDQEKGEQLAKEVGLTFVRCDLAREAEVVSLIGQVGLVDLLVNNGGVSGPTAPVAEVSTADWERVFAVNVTATFVACREMVRLMRPAGRGTIVNMSAAAAKIGYPNRAAYAASKRAVLGLTASLAREVGADGIRVNAVLPAAVRGERMDTVIERYATANGVSIAQAEATYLRRQVTGRFIEPEEIAALILFLATDEARSITGEFISIDGGFE
ncbi:SDR family NAD(P)-dependent oxidoreductase [Roseomonas sp. KE2513]|uniref:SDR family NAD(P)-dependent oxidoreductase n=1 Tax=Roseomonas sp. KE2513 TaxID=2479202 RepID=UPI0018DF4B85|nr:SDR family oxidoreductase [Roseomonas sp. KE2513]